ncbi:coniferyl-alcohol dehydrogenase [Salinispirillum marinum]|uniref:Coniferyl-alcohol dehydrogenase n=2 Tax=Saccharospirillaceae TaxID=255527 RepID=A0ABV8BEC4_9GAMM
MSKAKKILKDKTIVVTGSSSGIGLATAAQIKRLGGRVLGVDIHAPHGDAADVVDEFYKADLSQQAMIDALVFALPQGIDGLANIAGLPPTAPAEKVLAVNLVGLKYLTEKLIPKMNNGASIVNLASLAGGGWADAISTIKASEGLTFDAVADFVRQHNVSSVGGRSYFFSKEALIVWTLQNRWTWRERGIRMNAVSPGPVDTPILGDFIETLGARAEKDMATMDRPGHPDDIAPVVAFLLSDMTTWIRGTNIPVDGGMASHLLCEGYGL